MKTLLRTRTSSKSKSVLRGAAWAIGGTAVLAGLTALAVVSQRHPVGNSAVPVPTKPVDLKRYLGTWYEIARYEQIFQKGCDGVSATYTLRPDGKVGVVNRCREASGRKGEATARAYVVANSGGAKLKISFFGPFYVGNYWVMDHADDYSWAIVGDSSGRNLWLLDRRPVPPRAEVDALVNRAKTLGYDTSMLRWTQQP